MSQDFVAKSNKELDEACASSRTNAELREKLLEVMARQGTIVRDPTDPTNVQGVAAPPAPALPAEGQATATHFRVIYPHLNDRFEITGSSEAALDERERQIRALYAK